MRYLIETSKPCYKALIKAALKETGVKNIRETENSAIFTAKSPKQAKAAVATVQLVCRDNRLKLTLITRS